MTAGHRVLVFLGPPGSGKGTQAKMLAEKLNIPNFALGDMLREEVNAGTELGKRVGAIINGGNLVPDEITIGLTRQRVKKDDCRNGFIIDGFPRTFAQAEGLDQILAENKWEIDKVVYFRIAEDEVVKRLSERRSCRSCGAVYHLAHNPSKKPGVCDRCGGELYLRHDDEPQVIRTRFEVYEKMTRPLVEFYRTRGKLVEVSASQPIAQVLQDLLKAVQVPAA